jgi:hypothetical protein
LVTYTTAEISPAAEIESQEQEPAPLVLDVRSGEVQEQEIEDQMAPSPVHEHVGDPGGGLGMGWNEPELRVGVGGLSVQVPFLEFVQLCLEFGGGNPVPVILESSEPEPSLRLLQELLHCVPLALAVGHALEYLVFDSRIEFEFRVEHVEGLDRFEGEVRFAAGSRRPGPSDQERHKTEAHDGEGDPRPSPHAGLAVTDGDEHPASSWFGR